MSEQKSMQSRKKIALVVSVVLAVAVSWLRPLDDFTEDYLNESIKTAAIIFGIARAINAAVSVTQSAEVGIGVASVSPGEALDPINDLIEQFSEVMTVSLASLVFQRILVEIAAHWIFNTLVTLAAAAFIAALLLRRYQAITLKVFAIAVVFRLFLSLVILANSAVDTVFLDSKIEAGKAEIETLQDEVGNAVALASTEEIAQVDKAMAELKLKRKTVTVEIAAIAKTITNLEAKKGKRPWWLPEAITRNPERKGINAEIKQLENQIKETIAERDAMDAKIAALQKNRGCLEKRAQGGGCTWWERLKKSGDILKMPTIDIGDKIDSLITLMALIVLRSIMLPLAFWIVIYKAIRWIWTKQTGPRAA